MYSLIGVDGNAFAVMAYTANALKEVGLEDKVQDMYDRAMSDNYYNLLAVCCEYLNMANYVIAKEGK